MNVIMSFRYTFCFIFLKIGNDNNPYIRYKKTKIEIYFKQNSL